MSKFTALPIALWLISSLLSSCSVETDKSKRPSPPAGDTSLIQTAQVIIEYSSPAVKKRKLAGGLIPYRKVWRTGANEATTFTTDKKLLVMGRPLEKGRYAVFTKASTEYWTIIFNKEWDQWGSYNYDEEKDAIRVQILPYQTEDFSERMRFFFKDEELVFHWGQITYSLEMEEATLSEF